MKLHQIALAVAALAAAGQAQALSPTDVAAARAAGTLTEVWMSGASAVTRNQFEAFKADCRGGVSIYTSHATGTVPGNAGNFLAYACNHATTGNTVLYVNVNAGSFGAFAPHVTPTRYQRLRAIGAPGSSCPNSGANEFGDMAYRGCTLASVADAAAGADGGPRLPAGGYSDVESALFQDLFTIPPSSVGSEVAAGVAQVFGVAVSTNLYRALQVAQGKNSATCTDDTYTPAVAATATTPAEPGRHTQNGLHDFRNPACMPNITSAQYTAIAAVGGGYQTDWSPLLGTAGIDQTVNLCRRVDTSGSQAASNAHFLGNPCNRGRAGGQLAVLTPADSTATKPDDQGGIWVTSNPGTGDVKACLNRGNDGVTVNNVMTVQPHFAIGVVSLENDPLTEQANADDYRFIMVDGVSPENLTDDRARQNAINGEYRFVMELVAYTANSAAPIARTLINRLNANMARVGGADLRGLYILPSATADHTVHPTRVGKGTRGGNNCQPMNLFF